MSKIVTISTTKTMERRAGRRSYMAWLSWSDGQLQRAFVDGRKEGSRRVFSAAMGIGDVLELRRFVWIPDSDHAEQGKIAGGMCWLARFPDGGVREVSRDEAITLLSRLAFQHQSAPALVTLPDDVHSADVMLAGVTIAVG